MSEHFCSKCGMRLEFRARPTGKHDPFTGAPSQHEYLVWPKWRSFLGIGNGHDWEHHGVNPIDGITPFGPDPGKMENPPSPPDAFR